MSRAITGRRRAHAARMGAVGIAAVATMTLASTDPAAACGGLVDPNGNIQLERTTTLAAYTDGVQRYVTGFEFSGEGEEVGSIVPLPDVPSDVERGGDWTLQRLQREVNPPEVPEISASDDRAFSAESVEVHLETEIDALDITVVEGGAAAVGEWAHDNGFFLPPDAPEVLEYYAERSEVFMLARFDASRAEDIRQGAGDSTPIMATIPTDDPWVPLRILGVGADATDTIEADVFLLTEDEPQLLAGGEGLSLDLSERASDTLLDDLRSDENMEWLPHSMWLTHLTLEQDAGALDFDLAVSAHEDSEPSLQWAGVAVPSDDAVVPGSDGRRLPFWPVALGLTAAALAAGVIIVSRPPRTRPVGASVVGGGPHGGPHGSGR